MHELDLHKKLIFKFLLEFTVVAGVLFCLMNYWRDQYFLAGMEFTAVVISCFIYFYLKKSHVEYQLNRLRLLYLIMLFTFMMIGFSTEGVTNSIYAWMLLIPLLSYLLLGVVVGFWVTLFYYGLSALIFFTAYNGHQLIDDRITQLNIISCALLFWGLSHVYESTSLHSKLKSHRLMSFDNLTDLYNRSMMNKIFNDALVVAMNKNQPISLIVFDIDQFKHINDKFGYDIGDEVLKKFSSILKNKMPQNGSAIRSGNEEFIIIWPCAAEVSARAFAENIRRATAEIIVSVTQESLLISASAGVVSVQPATADLETLIKMAERRMYKAKHEGRNIVLSKH